MEQKLAIDIKDVVIRYRSFKKLSIKKSLLSLKKNDIEYFEAIKGVSFSVREGEILGIIGKNGSGKSTLLRALANIYSPDSGTIDLFNHSVSLLALGVGFEKKLTGRENIVLSGMLLGFSEKEVHSKMNEIIEFAELGQFIDKPVSTYSSGMYSKLAFAITAHLTTDIILIDEVLSVGDTRFKKKSYKKMLELINDSNKTVVIVSHNMDSLKKLCDDVLWIDDGKVVMQGRAEDVIARYEEKMQLV